MKTFVNLPSSKPISTNFTCVYIGKNFKNLLHQNDFVNFNQTCYKSSLGKGSLKLYKSRARSSSKGKKSLKIFFSWSAWSSRPISNKLDTNHPRLKGNWSFYKMCVYIEKIFSRTSRPILIKLRINHPWVKGNPNCSNKRPGPIQRGDNYKNAKMGWFHLKIFPNHWARIGHTYMKAFWYNVDSELFTSWSPGVGRGHKRAGVSRGPCNPNVPFTWSEHQIWLRISSVYLIWRTDFDCGFFLSYT